MKTLRTLGAPALLSILLPILLAGCAPLPSSPPAAPAAPESGAPAAGESAPTAEPAPETATGTSTETVTETATMTTTEAAPGASSEATAAATPQAATGAPVPLAEPVTTTIPLTTSPERSIVPPAGGEHTNGTHAPAAGGHETTDQGDHSGHSMANPAGPFDAAFIDDMILHHEGAIAMAQDLLQNSERPEFVEMGNAILAAQGAEIEIMRGWRAEWYPELPAGQTTGMTMGQMAVDVGDSVSYEERFIVAMIDHHAGAIAMAQRALEEAEHAELRDLATQIIAAQEAEIAQMQTWLEELQSP